MIGVRVEGKGYIKNGIQVSDLYNWLTGVVCPEAGTLDQFAGERV